MGKITADCISFGSIHFAVVKMHSAIQTSDLRSSILLNISFSFNFGADRPCMCMYLCACSEQVLFSALSVTLSVRLCVRLYICSHKALKSTDQKLM